MIKEWLFQIGALSLLIHHSHAMESMEPLPFEDNPLSHEQEQELDSSNFGDGIVAASDLGYSDVGNPLDGTATDMVQLQEHGETLFPQEGPPLPIVLEEAELEQPLKLPPEDEGPVTDKNSEANVLEIASAPLPKMRGIKSMILGLFLIGLIFFLNEISYYAEKEDMFSKVTYKLMDLLDSTNEKMNVIFRFDPIIGLEILIGGGAFFLSGLAVFVHSLLKRRQAKRGVRVDLMPPLRGLIELMLGLMIMGFWAASPNVESTLHVSSDAGFAVMAVGAILLSLSLLQRALYRAIQWSKTRNSPPTAQLADLPEKN